MTRFTVVLCFLYLLKACLLSIIVYAHCSFHHKMDLDLGLLVLFVLGISMLAASIIASVSRSTAVFIVLELIGFSTNLGYEFVSYSRYSSQLAS